MEESSEETSESTTQIVPSTVARRVYPTWQCPICGTRTWITNRRRHLDTKKHRGVLYITSERFEIRQ
jgi:hypothetical protein